MFFLRKRWLHSIGTLLSSSILIVFITVPEQNLFSQQDPLLGRIVKDIELRGLVNVKSLQVLSRLRSRIGEATTPRYLSEDIQNLYATDFFSNIQIDGQLLADKGIRLIYKLVENPFIAEIEYIGFERVNIPELQISLENRENNPFKRKNIVSDRQILIKALKSQGYPFAEVWTEVMPYTSKKKKSKKIFKNYVRIQFFADTGDAIEVAKVNIIGVRNVPIKKVRDQLSIDEASSIKESFFDKEKFNVDQEKILYYLKSQGFLNAEIDNNLSGYEISWKNPNDPSAGRVIVINFAYREFEQFFFAGYSFEYDEKYINRENNPPQHIALGNSPQPIIAKEVFVNVLEYHDGELGSVFDEVRYLNDRSQMQNLYGNYGYIFMQAQPEIIDFQLNENELQKYSDCRSGKIRNRICQRVSQKMPIESLKELLKKNPKWKNRNFRHVLFTIRENFLAYVENIVIRGNEKTDENVIRREILIKEGQLFNSTLVNETRRRLINTRYFKAVNLEFRPGSRNDTMTLIFDVEEQATGMISLGAGLGTLSGFSVFAQLSENNLFGSGQSISGRIEYGPLRNNLSLNWTDPWYYDRCQIIGGGYWRKRMQTIDNAQSLQQLDFLINEIEVEDEKVGAQARKVLGEAFDFVKTQTRSKQELLDATKEKLRNILAVYLKKEEACFRDVPKPWSLNIGVNISNTVFSIQPISVAFVPGSLSAEYTFQRISLSIGTSKAINSYWSHYHYYIPSFLSISNASALATDEVFLRQRLGFQFTSTVRNGLLYNSIDNVGNPTSGIRSNFELEITGGVLGGSDHFNRFTIANRFYFWWFDYETKKNRNRKLRNYRVVQEVTLRSIFSVQTNPSYGRQDRNLNPYLEIDQRLYAGGTGSRSFGRIRGFDQTDIRYLPVEWANGSDHLLEFGTEIRFPIDPNIAWFVLFFDAAALFENLSTFSGSSRNLLNSYQQGNVDSSQVTNGSTFTNTISWNDPRRLSLTGSNIALDRFLYSWGFGIRLQIPIFPLRIYFAQKLYYRDGGLRHIEHPGNYDIVIGLGDVDF